MRNNEVERIVKQEEIRFQGVLKRRVQRIAEGLFFKTVSDFPENAGLIIEKGNVRIVCLILIGELFNGDHIEKCLSAGYSRIVVCTNEDKGIEDLRKSCFKGLSNGDRHRVVVLNPDRLTKYLMQFKDDCIATEEVKGWKVKVEFIEKPKEDTEQKVNAVIRVLANAKVCNR